MNFFGAEISLSMVLHGLLWFVGWLVFCRVRKLPVARPGVEGRRLSVIIPARDEEENIVPLLDSLRKGTILPGEVIVADDHSSDRTADRARSGGARVVACREAPAGWQGKTWACAEGARDAQGEFLLFLDADTRLEKEGLAKLLSRGESADGALSLPPYHDVQKPYESLSAFFNLVQMISSGAFTIFPSVRMKRLFGPCLLIRRSDYDRVGGHSAVKDKILEHFFLSEILLREGVPLGIASGEGVLRYRMYPNGWGDLVKGWSKAFAGGAAGTSWLLPAVIAWFTGALGTARHLLSVGVVGPSSLMPVLVVFYGLYVVQIHWMLRRAGRFGFFTALFYPVGMAFFVGIIVYSTALKVFGRQVSWKGRKTSS